MGFIEHFDDPFPAISKHVDLLKPGGILLLGVPNYSGIYKPVLQRLAPTMLSTHNLRVMDIDTWPEFEKRLPVDNLFKAYVGGFEPLNMKKLEICSIPNQIIYFMIRVLMTLFSFNLQIFRKINSKHISGYLIGIYRKR
jgi:SAM-dependent methyltransferase